MWCNITLPSLVPLGHFSSSRKCEGARESIGSCGELNIFSIPPLSLPPFTLYSFIPSVLLLHTDRCSSAPVIAHDRSAQSCPWARTKYLLLQALPLYHLSWSPLQRTRTTQFNDPRRRNELEGVGNHPTPPSNHLARSPKSPYSWMNWGMHWSISSIQHPIATTDYMLTASRSLIILITASAIPWQPPPVPAPWAVAV